MRKRRMDSALETALFASSTAAWMSAISSGSSVRSAVASAGSVLLLPVLQRLLVQGDQAGDERAAVADHHALADQRVRAEPVLEHGRRHVLAARGDDELLLPPGDPQEAFVVE